MEEEKDINYYNSLKKFVHFLFGDEKPPIVLRIISIVLITIHAIEFLLFVLVSVFVALAPERYYKKEVLSDFADLGDDFFYGYTLLQIILLAILLFIWRKKRWAVYLYTVFSMVEILIPHFLVKNTSFPWVILLINIGVVASLFYLLKKEEESIDDSDENTEELEELIEQ